MYILIPIGSILAIILGGWLFCRTARRAWNEAHDESSNWDDPWSDEW